MATNEILLFAGTDTGTNLLSQAEYDVDAQRPIGNQPGVARSKLVNKALRQASLISAGIAEFLADNQANDITDALTPQNISDYMSAVVRSIGIPTAVAGGTADAITADFSPDVSLTNGVTVIVRAGSANATTTPTFAPDGLTAKTIVKGNNLALAAGDIAGAGHWLELNFDSVLDKWVLQNPYTSVQFASDAEAKAGVETSKALSPAGLKAAQIQLGTLTSGAGVAIDFTGIPSWAKRISIMFNQVSTNGTSAQLIQIGDSGGIENSGYVGIGSANSNGAVSSITNYTTGFATNNVSSAAQTQQGIATLTLMDAATNLWAFSSVGGLNIAVSCFGAGVKSLSHTLDRVRITMLNGTDAFDAGSINISWE